MGQILNRAFSVAKSLMNDNVSLYNIDNSGNEELKRIIDELGRDKKQYDTNNEKKQSTESSEINFEGAYKILKISKRIHVYNIQVTCYKWRMLTHMTKVTNMINFVIFRIFFVMLIFLEAK